MLTSLNRSTNVRFIFKCIREKNSFFLIHYLRSGGNRYILDENGSNLLMNIMKYGTPQMLESILSDYDETYDLEDENNKHLLYYLAERKDIELDRMRSILLRSNYEIDVQNTSRGALLYHCILNKNIRMINLLLAMNCDVNVCDDSGDPVIFYSVKNGLLEISNMLINRPDFDVNRRSSCGETILEVSLQKNMCIHGTMLLRKLPQDIKDKGQTLKLMEICIEKKNTIMAWKLYQNHCAFVIQKAFRKKCGSQ